MTGSVGRSIDRSEERDGSHDTQLPVVLLVCTLLAAALSLAALSPAGVGTRQRPERRIPRRTCSLGAPIFLCGAPTRWVDSIGSVGASIDHRSVLVN